MKKKTTEKHKLNGITIPGTLKETTWIDATQSSAINVKDIKKHDAIYYCTKRKTIGKVIKKDDTGIVIITDMDENGDCDIIAIPKKWIE